MAGLLATTVFVAEVSGQTTSSGALSGVVVDKTNAVVGDAAVEITDVAKGTTDSSKTNGEGVYQFSFLRLGTYARWATNNPSPSLFSDVNSDWMSTERARTYRFFFS